MFNLLLKEKNSYIILVHIYKYMYFPNMSMEMMMTRSFSFVKMSPFPFMISCNMFSLFLSLILLFSTKMTIYFFLNMIILLMIIFLWGNSVLSEYLYLGYFDLSYYKSVKVGMMWFIFSEVMFFASFFSSFIFYSLAQKIEFGLTWFSIEEFKMDFMGIPLMNTYILLYSGFILTLAHIKMLLMKSHSKLLIFITMLLGMIFLTLQLYEYKESVFSISDSVFGNSFFLYTSFHGMHVMIGFILLTITYLFSMFYFFSNKKIVFFEMSAWYWHFVDVVWLFLFFLVYTWNMTY